MYKCCLPGLCLVRHFVLSCPAGGSFWSDPLHLRSAWAFLHNLSALSYEIRRKKHYHNLNNKKRSVLILHQEEIVECATFLTLDGVQLHCPCAKKAARLLVCKVLQKAKEKLRNVQKMKFAKILVVQQCSLFDSCKGIKRCKFCSCPRPSLSRPTNMEVAFSNGFIDLFIGQ